MQGRCGQHSQPDMQANLWQQLFGTNFQGGHSLPWPTRLQSILSEVTLPQDEGSLVHGIQEFVEFVVLSIAFSLATKTVEELVAPESNPGRFA